MKEIKSQSASTITNEEFVVTSTNFISSPHLAKVISLTNHYSSKNPRIQMLDENTGILRRHSFDDNGGGYEGL